MILQIHRQNLAPFRPVSAHSGVAAMVRIRTGCEVRPILPTGGPPAGPGPGRLAVRRDRRGGVRTHAGRAPTSRCPPPAGPGSAVRSGLPRAGAAPAAVERWPRRTRYRGAPARWPTDW